MSARKGDRNPQIIDSLSIARTPGQVLTVDLPGQVFNGRSTRTGLNGVRLGILQARRGGEL